MSGFTENQASQAGGRYGAADRVMTWQASRDMLPLVGQIAQEVIALSARLARLLPEQASLDRRRLQLDWPGRSRRYQLDEEIVQVQAELRRTEGELEALGLAVLDGEAGLVGFPTLVNERRAFFSWQPGEEQLGHWNYADEQLRRPVPEEWTLSEPTRIVRVRSKPRRK